jgi:hypothetical protein
MNVGDRVRVEDENSAVEGTIVETWLVNGHVYVKVCYLDHMYISRSTSQYEVSVLAPAEPLALGTMFKDADGYDYVKWSDRAAHRENWIGVLSGNHYSWEDIPK